MRPDSVSAKDAFNIVRDEGLEHSFLCLPAPPGCCTAIPGLLWLLFNSVKKSSVFAKKAVTLEQDYL